MLLLVCFIALAVADVAIVEFNDGSLRGNIRFSQENGYPDVVIVSNIQDISGNLGTEVTWGLYNQYVNVTLGETCDDKGEVWDPNSIDMSESYSCSGANVVGTCALGDLSGYLNKLQLGYTTYHTQDFEVSALWGLTLALGDDVGCVGVVETPEALRLVMEARWDSAVEEDVIDDLEAVLENLFNSSLVSVEYFYPVHANATLKNVPLQATNENLEQYISSAIYQILSLKSYETIEVSVTDTDVETEKNVYFIVTSYSSGTHEFHHNNIKYAASFANQVQDGINLDGSLATGVVWGSVFDVVDVDLKTTIVLTTTDVSEGTDVLSDIEALIPELTSQIADLGGTLVDYTITAETRSPTKAPSIAPTTPMPSGAPTVIPSFSPSTGPSVAPSCSGTLHNYLGDPLIEIAADESFYSNENETMTITLSWPRRYSVQSIDFNGDSGNIYQLTASSDGLWESNEADNCLTQYTIVLAWSDVADGTAGITWNGATNSFDGRVDVGLTEEFEKLGSVSLGNEFTREVSLEMPFAIQLKTSIVVPHTIEIGVSDALLTSKVLTGLTVIAPNGNDPAAHVSTTFITQVPFPWTLNEDKFTITDHNGHLIGGTETLNVTASDNCDPSVLNVDCKQYWLASWDSNSVCDQRGNVTISITAQYTMVPPYVDEEVIDVTMTISLLPSCVQTVSTLTPEGSLTLYTDSAFSSDSLIFYIDEEIYGRIYLETKQPMYSVSLNSLTVEQDGNLKNLRTAAFEYEEVDRSVGSSATIDFKARLSIDELEGRLTGKTTVLRADVTVAYEDGERRRMEISLGEPETNSNVETTVIILDDSPCFEPKKRVGDFVEIPCDNGLGESQYKICENTGWRTVSECSVGDEQHIDIILEEPRSNESSGMSPWMIASLALGASICAAGGIWYKYELSNKSKFEFSSTQA